MWESDDGIRTAATRQCAGSIRDCSPRPPEYGPAGTMSAPVIVMSADDIAFRFVHGISPASAPINKRVENMVPPSLLLGDALPDSLPIVAVAMKYELRARTTGIHHELNLASSIAKHESRFRLGDDDALRPIRAGLQHQKALGDSDCGFTSGCELVSPCVLRQVFRLQPESVAAHEMGDVPLVLADCFRGRDIGSEHLIHPQRNRPHEHLRVVQRHLVVHVSKIAAP